MQHLNRKKQKEKEGPVFCDIIKSGLGNCHFISIRMLSHNISIYKSLTAVRMHRDIPLYSHGENVFRSFYSLNF